VDKRFDEKCFEKLNFLKLGEKQKSCTLSQFSVFQNSKG